MLKISVQHTHAHTYTTYSIQANFGFVLFNIMYNHNYYLVSTSTMIKI